MQPDRILRIALIGPESSGKTTLAEQLANHFHTIWILEFARDYIAELNRPYTYEDVLFCTQQQQKMEDEGLKKANQLLFADTELILHKIWLWDIFKKYPLELDVEINKHQYDLYLLTTPDLPFVDDPVRENPHRRDYFFNLYEQELIKRGFNYTVLNDSGSARLKKAIEVVEQFLREKKHSTSL